MNTIHFYGPLKAMLGDKTRLDVASPAEAVRAIITLFPAADTFIRQGSFILVRRTYPKGGRIPAKGLRAAMEDDTYQVGEDMLTLGLGKSDLHIIPVVSGEGKSIGKIILGVAMVAGAWALAPVGAAGAAGTVAGQAMGASAFSLLGMSVSFGSLAALGVMTALSGISQLLAKPPKAPEPKDKNESFIFSAPANVGSQGNCVPLVYGGPIRVGSVTVSSAVTTQKWPAGPTRLTGLKGAIQVSTQGKSTQPQ